MSQTYLSYKASIANLMAVSATTADFLAMFPDLIDYSEQRIYRDLDLLSTIVKDASASLTTNNRNFTLPSAGGRFVTVQGVNVVTPVSTAPDSGIRNELIPISRDYLDAVWNSVSGATVPVYFAMMTDQTLIVGPWPNNSYTVEIVGTIRPLPLTASNTTTFLTLYLPDLFLAAGMVFASGFMRNFGSQSDNPQIAQSWESQYNTLLASAKPEELRKRFSSLGWTSHQDAAPAAER